MSSLALSSHRGPENLQPVRSTVHLVQERQTGLVTVVAYDHVVQLRHHKRREHQRAAVRREGIREGRVIVLDLVDGDEQPAGIED